MIILFFLGTKNLNVGIVTPNKLENWMISGPKVATRMA